MVDQEDQRLQLGAYLTPTRPAPRLYQVAAIDGCLISLENASTGRRMQLARMVVLQDFRLVKAAPPTTVPDRIPEDMTKEIAR